jgi:hypothetical protein
MATFDPFTEQIIGLREQQALAQKLRDQGMQAPEGQTVSGVYVAPRNTQYLAQALKSYLGGQDVQQAQQGIKDLVAKREAENAAFLSGMPKATETQVEVRTPEMMNQMGPSPLSKMLRVNPTPEQQLEYAANAPGISPVDIGNLAVKGAELQANREARLAERQMAVEAEARRLRERAAEKIDEEARRHENRQSDIRLMSSLRPTHEEKLKPIPLSANQAILGNDQSLKQLNDTISLIESNPNAVGFKGYMPNAVLNRVNPEGTEARAGIADIGSLKLHERSGAAVTASESPRLMPFIPLATDDAPTVLKKLNRLRDIVGSEQQGLSEIYSPDQGYRANPISGRNVVPQPNSDGFSIRPKQP